MKKLFIVLAYLVAASALAENWERVSLPGDYWLAVASSADGTKLVAGGDSNLWLSADSGLTWNNATNSPNTYWRSIASSADGTRLLAAPFNGQEMFLSDDSGANWRPTGPFIGTEPRQMQWASVACSSDGKMMIGALSQIQGEPAPVYISTNSGASWTEASAPANYWGSVVSSADGTKLTAAASGSVSSGGLVYTSTDSGNTWMATSLPVQNWTLLASTAEGNKIMAVTHEAHIYTSADAGRSWTEQTNFPRLPTDFANALVSSADGTKLVLATGYQFDIWPDLRTFISRDWGNTWSQDTNAPAKSFNSFAMSADGSQLLASWSRPGNNRQGEVYISQNTPALIMNIASVGTNLLLSWVLPRQPFVLQQCSDLSSGNWSTTTNVPDLNRSTLRNELFLTSPNGCGSYRLVREYAPAL